MTHRPIALTIAGSDSSGGAGVQADLKTFSALGVYGASVLTAITAQNTKGVQGVEMLPAAFVDQQLDSVLSDLKVDAIKTGMLGTAEIIHLVAERIAMAGCPSVVDPVMVATSGDLLIRDDAVDVLRRELLPRATVITPNVHEAAALLRQPPARSLRELEEQGRRLCADGARAVLMKGGHLAGTRADDVLVEGERVTVIEGVRIESRNTHGTGCTLASAIAAHLAAGFELVAAIKAAKLYLTRALRAADALDVGNHSGPVDHLFAIAPPIEGEPS